MLCFGIGIKYPFQVPGCVNGRLSYWEKLRWMFYSIKDSLIARPHPKLPNCQKEQSTATINTTEKSSWICLKNIPMIAPAQGSQAALTRWSWRGTQLLHPIDLMISFLLGVLKRTKSRMLYHLSTLEWSHLTFKWLMDFGRGIPIKTTSAPPRWGRIKDRKTRHNKNLK